MTWCEHCRDHYDVDHYVASWTSPTGDTYAHGAHGVGEEYGPYGVLLAKAAEAERYALALERIATLKPMLALDPRDTQVRCRRIAQEALGRSVE